MPYKTTYVEPEIFMEYKGVKVFREYKDREYDQPLHYHFTTISNEDEEPESDYSFDVREIKLPPSCTLDFIDDDNTKKLIIEYGIVTDQIKIP